MNLDIELGCCLNQTNTHATILVVVKIYDLKLHYVQIIH